MKTKELNVLAYSKHTVNIFWKNVKPFLKTQLKILLLVCIPDSSE